MPSLNHKRRRPRTIATCTTAVLIASAAMAGSGARAVAASLAQPALPLSASLHTQAALNPQSIQSPGAAFHRSIPSPASSVPFRGDDRQTVVPPPVQKSNALVLPVGPKASTTTIQSNLSVPTGFAGIANTGTSAGDPNGAGGPSDVVEVVNNDWIAYSRTGTPETTTQDLQQWFNNKPSQEPFDPRITYDYFGGAFVLIGTSKDSIWLSVSQQNSAIGTWCNYQFSGISSSAWPSGDFADYPELGISNNFINVSMNVFNSSNSFQFSRLFTISKSEVETCVSVTWGWWSGLNDPGTGLFGSDVGDQGAFAISPTQQYDSSDFTYLVDSYSGGGCSVTLWTMTGQVVSNSSLGLVANKIGTQCYNQPVTAQQKGSSTVVVAGDSRIEQSVLFNGSLDFALDTKHNFNCDGDDDAIAWFRLNPTTQSVKDQKTFGQGCYYYLYPTMQSLASGAFVISFDEMSSSIYPSAAVYGFDAFDAPEAGQITANGDSADAEGTPASWGDYSSAHLDPIATYQAWIVGEMTHSSFWASQIAVASA